MRYIKTYEGYYTNELNQKFWKEFRFDERIREKLLTIAQEFYQQFELKNAPIVDVILTGSMCGYNWNKNSDLDIHVVVDFTQINADKELVKKALDGQRFIWNIRHNISIRGHDVELYVQDKDEEHTAIAMYSLLKNEWIKKPEYNPPTIDEVLVDFKTKTYMSGIEEMEKIVAGDLTPEEATSNHYYAKLFKDKIMKIRGDALKAKGEFCVENLVFKNLRNAGYLERLIDVVNAFYDEIYIQ